MALVESRSTTPSTPRGGAGIDVLLARTGYTGEDGFELYVPNAQAAALWRALLAATTAAGGIAAGLACRDTLRLEAGMALYGHELSQATNPYQAGLGQVVNLDKAFVGRDALQHVSERPTDRMLVGLKGSTRRRAARAGYPVHDASGVSAVGTVTSGALSPTLGYPDRAGLSSTPPSPNPAPRSGRHPRQQEPFTVVPPRSTAGSDRRRPHLEDGSS